MGFDQNELAQLTCAEAVAELRQDYKNGILSKDEFDELLADTVDFYHPKYTAPVKVMPEANPYVPTERELIIGGLGEEFAIDPETGRILALTPEAQERMTVEADTSGSAGTGKRFPSGSAIVLGLSKAGKLINKLLTLGAATAEPYRKAAYIAQKTAAKGGFCFFGCRTAGYELHKATGSRWDGISPKPEGLELRPARDRMVGKRQVVGQAGQKGLALIDARTMMPPTPQQVIEFYVWLQACGETQAADRLAAFSLKTKTTKADSEAARAAASAMAGGVPYHKRGFTVRFAKGKTWKLNMATREMELVTYRVPIGCSALDTSLPHQPTGMPFRIYWQALRLRLPGMGIDPFEAVTYDFGGAKPTDPEGCLKHAQVLALRTAGTACVQHVTWQDADGEHMVSRGDALLALRDADEDEYLAEVRSGYKRGMDPEAYAQDVCEALDHTSGSHTRHNRDDDWWEAHELVIKCNEALATTSREDAKDISQEEEVLKAKVAKVRDEAQAKKIKAMRKLVPGYVKPGAILTKGPRREVEHDWPTRNARAKNSRKGGTWNKRAQAQRLDSSWRKNHRD